jgi:E3 ubiquitin-protein ligase DOA10
MTFLCLLICLVTDDEDACSSKVCWICYDGDRQDVGPLIQPCQCRGDVSSVHHDCLRRWLVEVSINSLLVLVIHMHRLIAIFTLRFKFQNVNITIPYSI